MFKLNLICWLVAISILICGAFYMSYLKNSLASEKASNQQLTLTLEKRNNDVVALSRTKKELEARIKADTSGFDWNFDLSNSEPLLFLQEQCVSCPK